MSYSMHLFVLFGLCELICGINLVLSANGTSMTPMLDLICDNWLQL